MKQKHEKIKGNKIEFKAASVNHRPSGNEDNVHRPPSLTICPDFLHLCSLPSCLPSLVAISLPPFLLSLPLSPSLSLSLSLSIYLTFSLSLSDSLFLSLSIYLSFNLSLPLSFLSALFNSSYHLNQQSFTWLMWLSIPASLAIKGAEIRSGIPMSGMFFKIPFRTCIARIDGIERIV